MKSKIIITASVNTEAWKKHFANLNPDTFKEFPSSELKNGHVIVGVSAFIAWENSLKSRNENEGNHYNGF